MIAPLEEPSPDGLAPNVPEASITGPWRRILVLPDRTGTLQLTEVDSAKQRTPAREEERRYLDEESHFESGPSIPTTGD